MFIDDFVVNYTSIVNKIKIKNLLKVFSTLFGRQV